MVVNPPGANFEVNNMKKELTILLTCYNKEKYISYILQQLIDQNCEALDIHIFDDASTDNSLNIIQELVGDINNFTIHHWDTNKGTGSTRNYALSLVKTKYFIFIDADDMLTETYVQTILQKIRQYPDVDIHHFRTRVYPLGGTVMFNFSLWDRVISKEFLDKNNITFNPKLTNMEDWNLRVQIEKVPYIEMEHQEIIYIYNILAENTITHDNPIWYNHNLEGIRPESQVDYCEEYNK